MRYSPKQYASALFESLSEKGTNADVVVKGFVKMLVGNYDRALLPKILMQFKKLERNKAGRHEVVLTSARQLEKSVIADVKKKVGENSGIKEVIDPQVLGGVRILINDEIIIDGTLKSRIQKMVEGAMRSNV
jgi:F0F1-type ATP synthase delta subunit